MKRKMLLSLTALAMMSVKSSVGSEYGDTLVSVGSGLDDHDTHTKRNPDPQHVPYLRQSKRGVYRKR